MRRARTFAITLLSLGVAAATLASPAVAGGQLTKKEFRQQANQLCQVASVDIGGVFDEVFGGLPDEVQVPPEAVDAAVTAGLPIFRASLDAIEALDGPATYEKKVDKLLDRYRAATDEIEADPQLAFEDDDAIWAKADRAAKKLGLRDCVQG